MGHVFPEGSAPSPIPSQRNVVLALDDGRRLLQGKRWTTFPEQNSAF